MSDQIKALAQIRALDPYKLTGQEKKDALSRLYEIADSPNGTFPPSIKYEAVKMLLSEAERRKTQAGLMCKRFFDKKADMQFQAIDDFKKKVKTDFATKWHDNLTNKKFAPEMIQEWKIIQMMEKRSCYEMKELTVFKKKCELCPKKKECWRGVSI